MGDFEKSYQAWINTPFPGDGATEPLSELHADLALVDSWVADSVVPFVNGRGRKPAAVDVIKRIWVILAQIAPLTGSPDPEIRMTADSYAQYAQHLLEVYQEFLAIDTD